MKKSAIWFGVCLLLIVLGLCVCIPGICGCAGPSILPERWNLAGDMVAVVLEIVGVIGCAANGLAFLVLLARHAAKKDGQAARAGKGDLP